MGLLGKGTRTQPVAKTPIGPMQDTHLRQAAGLMEDFNRAVGHDSALRSVCAAIYGAAGITRLEDLLNRPGDIDIPWRWLEAAARAAASRGDRLLTSRIFGCAFFWNANVAPKLQGGDYADLCLPAAAPELEASLALLALPCLLAMPGDTVIFGNQTGQFRAAELAQVAARKIADFSRNGAEVHPELASLAQDVLATRAGQPRSATARATAAPAYAAAPAPDPADPAADPILGRAIAQMDRVKAALAQAGLRFVEIGTGFAAGVAVAFGDGGYTVLSVMGGGSEGVLNLTSGAARRVSGDRLRILEICNGLTRNNAFFPVYLHDADAGWDVLVQQRFPVGMLLADPAALGSFVAALPVVARSAREKLLEAGLAGQALRWNDEDVRELLIRSVM